MKIGDKITVTGPKGKIKPIPELHELSNYPFDAVILEDEEASSDKFCIDTPFYDETEGDAICSLSHFKYTLK